MNKKRAPSASGKRKGKNQVEKPHYDFLEHFAPILSDGFISAEAIID